MDTRGRKNTCYYLLNRQGTNGGGLCWGSVRLWVCLDGQSRGNKIVLDHLKQTHTTIMFTFPIRAIECVLFLKIQIFNNNTHLSSLNNPIEYHPMSSLHHPPKGHPKPKGEKPLVKKRPQSSKGLSTNAIPTKKISQRPATGSFLTVQPKKRPNSGTSIISAKSKLNSSPPQQKPSKLPRKPPLPAWKTMEERFKDSQGLGRIWWEPAIKRFMSEQEWMWKKMWRK